MGGLLPGAVAARQGRAVHARRQLHRVLLVEGVRQGRHHHLGDPADRLPVDRPGLPEYEPRGCPRGASFSWYTYSPTGSAIRMCAASLLEMWREARAAARRPGRGLGARSSTIPSARARTSGPAARAASSARRWDEVSRAGRRRPRPHGQAVRPRPGGGFLADPGDVDGLLRGRDPVPVADRRHVPVLLRLVRRPAGRLPAGLRRPDRRPGVRRLVERELPGHLGHEHPGHPHARRALHDRGALPRQKVVVVSARTSPTTRSSPTTGCPPRPGTDGALAMAMGHVILREFFVDRTCRTSTST